MRIFFGGYGRIVEHCPGFFRYLANNEYLILATTSFLLMKLFDKRVLIVILMLFPGFGRLWAQVLSGEVSFAEHRCLPGYGIRKAGHPEVFQGNCKMKRYFEGWYFKMVSSDGSSILSVIPGIALSPDGSEKHAFIQVIDGKTARTDYFTFPVGEFAFSRKEFAVRIGRNYFSAERLVLNLRNDSSYISGEIKMTAPVTLPSRRLLNPGIMGWYRFVPFMQCYHGVVSLSHRLQGVLEMDGAKLDFSNGKGYIEKDWGSSMPSAWIWMQSNNFVSHEASFMLSVANIPWLGKSFTGFLGFCYFNGTIHRFATYTRATLEIVQQNGDTLKILIRDRKLVYEISAVRSQAGLLKAPVKGSMDRRIPESIDARLKLTIKDKQGITVFNDSTTIAGLEIVGNQNILLTKMKR